jgi:hypothetical protein
LNRHDSVVSEQRIASRSAVLGGGAVSPSKTAPVNCSELQPTAQDVKPAQAKNSQGAWRIRRMEQ